jgi:hypothetical protein
MVLRWEKAFLPSSEKHLCCYLATCTEDHLGVRDHGAAPDSVHGQMGFNAVVGYLLAAIALGATLQDLITLAR